MNHWGIKNVDTTVLLFQKQGNFSATKYYAFSSIWLSFFNNVNLFFPCLVIQYPFFQFVKNGLMDKTLSELSGTMAFWLLRPPSRRM